MHAATSNALQAKKEVEVALGRVTASRAAIAPLVNFSLKLTMRAVTVRIADWASFLKPVLQDAPCVHQGKLPMQTKTVVLPARGRICH